LREAGQFERQRGNLSPLYEASQRQVREDGRGEAFVFAVPLLERGDVALRLDKFFGTLGQPLILGGNAGKTKRRLNQHRRRDIRAAALCIAPAAVSVLSLREPMEAVDDQLAQVALDDVLHVSAGRRLLAIR